ncbi:MAG: MFS transporter, partial [Nocardioides sp.]
MHTLVEGRISRELAFAGLLVGLLMAQLDTNVVVAALPAIASDLGVGASATFAVYLLAVTIATPLLGALGDRHGRRPVFAASMVLFGAGSAAAAAAPTLLVLVGARVVQGVGGAGLVISAVATIGEMFDAQERIRRQGWLATVFAVSSLAGPPVGGWVAAGPGWRAIFAVNLPLCALGLALGARSVPAAPTARSGGRFDWAGAALIALGGSAVLALGSSATVAGSAAAAAAAVAVAAASAVLLVRV